MASHVRRNDIVQVISGDDRLARGRVLKVLRREGRVVVEGINHVVKRHRRSAERRKGGRVKREAPLEISKVRVVCQSCDKPTKVRIRRTQEGRPVRICGRCGQGVALEG